MNLTTAEFLEFFQITREYDRLLEEASKFMARIKFLSEKEFGKDLKK